MRRNRGKKNMINYYRFLVFLIFLFNTNDMVLLGQKNSDLKPEMIIDKFIGKTGAEKWVNLKSRKEYAYVAYEKDKGKVVPDKSYDRIKVNLRPDKSIDLHRHILDEQTIMVFKPECNWYYTGSSQGVKFFGPEPIKFDDKYPRTELMEVLNLQPIKKVYIEDTLYRIDFKDKRQLDEKQSLFFGINSGLLFKRSYTSKNEVVWAYHFSNYTESQGFYEPYLVELTSNGEVYFTITVEAIKYNTEIDPQIFDPPIPCRNYDDFKHLEFPYILHLN